MRIPRIYTPQTLAEHTRIELDAAAAHYVARVLRMKPGRPLIVFDGTGGEYLGTLQQVSKKSIWVSLNSFDAVNRESRLPIHLGVCLIKNDPMDWLLQKATELGVSQITPLASEFTDTKIPRERMEKKLQHWRQVVIRACEQSGRTHLPVVAQIEPLSHWVNQVVADCKWVLHPHDSTVLTRTALDVDAVPNSMALLVGPEGGLSAAEVGMAVDRGFTAFSLGSRILRAETAPLAILSILQFHYNAS